MTNHRLPVLAACVASVASELPCQGQPVTTQLHAVTPLLAQCVVGGAVNQATLPIGPLPPSGFLRSWLGPLQQPTAQAVVHWGASFDMFRSQAVLSHSLFVDASAQGFASAGPNEVVVEFAASVATPIRLEAERLTQMPASAPWPLIAIDIGNDGSIEVPNLQAGGPFTLFATTVGTQPLPVRVVFSSQLLGTGNSFSTVTITARPDNDVYSVRNVLGCGMSFLFVEPTFVDRGIQLVSDAHFYVFGFSMQPLLLQPAPYPGSIPWSCLLMPTPDVVLFSTPGLQIPLPAAVRPVQFHVQGLFVSPADWLWTTDGYTVTAN